jgi:hypothetical protein
MSNARNLARLLPDSSGKVPTTQIGAGSVIQVVQSVYIGSGGDGTTTFSTASSSWTAMSGVSASITPKSSSNKVLVTFFVPNLYCPSNGQEARLTIYRNGTNISPKGVEVWHGFSSVMGNGAGVQSPVTVQYLDSPATTSSVTYALYWQSSSGTVYAGRNAPNFPINLMEIAA